MSAPDQAATTAAGSAFTPGATAAAGEQLLAAARQLGPLIRAHADAAERERRLAPLRDIQTVRQHAFAAEGRLETVGQVYLGAPPEFGLVAF